MIRLIALLGIPFCISGWLLVFRIKNFFMQNIIHICKRINLVLLQIPVIGKLIFEKLINTCYNNIRPFLKERSIDIQYWWVHTKMSHQWITLKLKGIWLDKLESFYIIWIDVIHTYCKLVYIFFASTVEQLIRIFKLDIRAKSFIKLLLDWKAALLGMKFFDNLQGIKQLRIIHLFNIIILFVWCFNLQLGINADKLYIYFLPTVLQDFIFILMNLWVIPYLFLLTWLGVFCLNYISILIVYYKNGKFLYSSFKQNLSAFNIRISGILHMEFTLILVLFMVLLLHTVNSSMPEEIARNVLINASNFEGLFQYSTMFIPLLILLLILLLASYIFLMQNINRQYHLIVIITYILMVFVICLLMFVHNFLILLFLLELLLILLFNLLRIQNYTTNITNFIRASLLFLIIQSIATMIYTYGLSVIYTDNPTLSFNTIITEVILEPNFYHEKHQFILIGGIFIIIGLLIKMGLGPLGLWTLFFVPTINFSFLNLYFNVIKTVYFIIFIKVFSVLYAPTFVLQQMLSIHPNIDIRPEIILEYFKLTLKNEFPQVTDITVITPDITLSHIVMYTQWIHEHISVWVLVFAVISVIIGAVGLLRTHSIRRFIAYSSLLNFGLVIYPVLSGNFTSINNIVMYIMVYSFLNTLFLFIITKSVEGNSDNLLAITKSKSVILNIALITIVASLAGLPPFVGFFTKITVLFDLWQILGPSSIIFIIFAIVSILGYTRIIKYIYEGTYSKIYEDISSIFSHRGYIWTLVFFDCFAIILILMNCLLGIAVLYCNSLSGITIFNSIAFSFTAYISDNLIGYDSLQYILNDLGISLTELEKSLQRVLNDPTLINDSVAHHTRNFVAREELLRGEKFPPEALHVIQTDIKEALKVLHQEHPIVSPHTPGGAHMLKLFKLSQEILSWRK